ncbi:MAG: Hsp20/alpha crystallin family protein, partial [Pseudomonadota bacterium]
MRNELGPVTSSISPRSMSRGIGRDLFRDYERLVDAMMGEPLSVSSSEDYLAPRVDVAETEKSIEVTAELAGVDEKDIKVELRNGMLWLSGKKEECHKEESRNVFRSERRFGSFERGVTLPCDVERGN